MLAYLARRLAASLFILLGVSVVTFGLTFIIPADPVAMIAGRNSTPDVREQIRHQLGLDRPLPEQYANYLGRLVRGDLGKSYARKSDVGALIASRLPPEEAAVATWPSSTKPARRKLLACVASAREATVWSREIPTRPS